MTTLTLNGETRHFDTPAAGEFTVAALLDELALTGKRVAVERNGEIVPKSQHGKTVLAEGDVIEVVVAVGGG